MPVGARPGYRLEAGYTRVVADDYLVTLDTNRYSVPFGLIGQTVEVHRRDGRLQIFHRGSLVVTHDELTGRHQMRILPEHGPGPVARNQRLRWSSRSAGCPPSDTSVEVEERDLTTYEVLWLRGGER